MSNLESLLSPKINFCTNSLLFCFKMSSLISLLQLQKGLIISWNPCLNFQWERWLKPRRCLISNLSPFGLWHLKMLFSVGRIKWGLSYEIELQNRVMQNDITWIMKMLMMTKFDGSFLKADSRLRWPNNF